MTGSAADVFISYKAEDRPRLQPLVTALEAEGFSVWWDARIGGGTNWREDIEEHLDAAKCVIVAWSKRSIGPEGEFVRDEATRAKRHRTYLPVRIDDVSPPLGFGEVQALSLTNWKGDQSDPRLATIIDAVRERITGEPVEHHAVDLGDARISRRTAMAGGIGIGAIAVAGAAGWLLLKPDSTDSQRIAVLPFANLSGDDDQSYFSDGIAEELRSALSRVGMEVIGRASSVAVKDLDTKTAAKKLGVAHILTGSVRRSPQMIRINAQLVSGKDGVERWAQSYDRAPGDAINIQTDIAENVARALSIALGQAGLRAIKLGGTSDPVAQEFFLRGRKLFLEASDEQAFREVVAFAEAALARDQDYADAYLLKASALGRLANAFSTSVADLREGVASAHKATMQALKIAPNLGWGHAVLAFIEGSRLNFSDSLTALRRALAYAPDNSDVLTEAGRILAFIGDGQEALRLNDRLIAVDPFNPRAYRIRLETLKYLRQYPLAIAAGRKALALAPENDAPRSSIGDCLVLLGRYAEAKTEYGLIAPDDTFRLTGEAFVAARTGNAAEAERIIARMKQLSGATASYQYAQIRVQLGKYEQAFDELDNAIEVLDPGLNYLKKDPFLDAIRDDPRYGNLVRKLRIPA